MDKYFSGVNFTVEELIAGSRSAMKERMIYPVFLSAAPSRDWELRSFWMPLPLSSRRRWKDMDEATADGDAIKIDPNGQAAAVIYKTISDQYGKFSLSR